MPLVLELPEWSQFCPRKLGKDAEECMTRRYSRQAGETQNTKRRPNKLESAKWKAWISGKNCFRGQL
jgi:hypothetical protein